MKLYKVELKNALLKKNFSLIWIKSLKNNFQVGKIWPPPALLNYPSALLSNKGVLLLKGRALIQGQFGSILHFNKKKILIIHIIKLKHFYHIFHASVLWHMQHNELYVAESECWFWKREIELKCTYCIKKFVRKYLIINHHFYKPNLSLFDVSRGLH